MRNTKGNLELASGYYSYGREGLETNIRGSERPYWINIQLSLDVYRNRKKKIMLFF